jgi:uncharacterized cupredoxin-like copper-binding protein
VPKRRGLVLADGAMPAWGWGTGNWWARPGSLIGVAALLVVLGASCGRPAGPEATASPTEEAEQVGSPAAQPLVLLMNEFSFAVKASPPPPGYPLPPGGNPLPSAALPAGSSVLVTLQNSGRIVHEWRVGRTLLPGGGYEDDLLAMMEPEVLSGTGYRLVEPEEGAAGGPGGVSIEVAPGAAVTLRLAVPADATGTWEMGCFVPGHYQAGMKAALRVE